MKSQIAAKLTRLIQDEVNKQLAENYYELLPNLIKTEVTQIEDDLQFAVGAAYFQIDERRLFIPILYMDGQVDAISYIADVETNRMYGLTKKMYKRLISANRLQMGTALTRAEQERLRVDKGIIGRLFATPQTLSAKIASDEDTGLVMDMLSTELFRTRFTKLASDPEKISDMRKLYSPELFEKLASLNSRDKRMRLATSASQAKSGEVYKSLSELRDLEPSLRKEAAVAIAKTGYYKVAEDINTGSKAAVLKIPKMGEQLFKTDSKLSVLTVPGIYNALTKDLNIVPVIVAEEGSERKLYYKDKSTVVSKDQAGHDLTEYVGLPAGALGGDPRQHISSVFGKAVKPKDARRILISIRKDDLKMYEVNTVTAVGDTTVIDSFTWGTEQPEVVIEISERFGYSKRGNTIFINPKHVTFIGKTKYSGLSSSYDRPKTNPLSELLVSDDMEQAFIKTASISIQYSAGMYDYNRERLGSVEMHQKLAGEGFDGESISLIMKTAEAQPGIPTELQNIPQTLKAILAELAENKHSILELREMLTGGAQGQEGQEANPEDEQIKQQILEVAGTVGADGNSIIEGGTQQGLPLPQILEQLQQEVSEVQQQGGGQPADPAAAGAEPGAAPLPMAGDPQQAGAQGPGQGPSAGPGQPAPGQTPGEATPQGLQEQGYNTQMSPQMLDQLQSVADKDVLNASIIQYLIDTPDAKGVVSQYLDDVEKGVNGLAKTLLTVEIQKKNFTKDVSEGKLISFINGGKTILNRLTDFVIDAAQID